MMPPQWNRAFLPHHDGLQYSETQSGNKFLLHALALPGSQSQRWGNYLMRKLTLGSEEVLMISLAVHFLGLWKRGCGRDVEQYGDAY